MIFYRHKYLLWFWIYIGQYRKQFVIGLEKSTTNFNGLFVVLILMVDWVWSIVTLTKITINIWLILISAGFTCLHIISLECLDPNSKPDIFRHWMVNTIVLGNGLVLNGTMAGLICMNVKRDAISCFASFQPIQISKGTKYFFYDVAS